MRARDIKPGFFKSDQLAECSLAARLLFAGLWMMADRQGRLERRPRRIKAELFPYDELDVPALLDELEAAGLVAGYASGGRDLLWVPGFLRHQSPHKNERPSELPPHPADIAGLLEGSAQRCGNAPGVVPGEGAGMGAVPCGMAEAAPGVGQGVVPGAEKGAGKRAGEGSKEGNAGGNGEGDEGGAGAAFQPQPEGTEKGAAVLELMPGGDAGAPQPERSESRSGGDSLHFGSAREISGQIPLTPSSLTPSSLTPSSLTPYVFVCPSPDAPAGASAPCGGTHRGGEAQGSAAKGKALRGQDNGAARHAGSPASCPGESPHAPSRAHGAGAGPAASSGAKGRGAASRTVGSETAPEPVPAGTHSAQRGFSPSAGSVPAPRGRAAEGQCGSRVSAPLAGNVPAKPVLTAELAEALPHGDAGRAVSGEARAFSPGTAPAPAPNAPAASRGTSPMPAPTKPRSPDSTDRDAAPAPARGAGRRASPFCPPTVAEVAEYCRQRGNRVDAARFCDFYESKGWLVGRTRMKDWRAAVRTWERAPERNASGMARPATVWQERILERDIMARMLAHDEAARKNAQRRADAPQIGHAPGTCPAQPALPPDWQDGR